MFLQNDPTVVNQFGFDDDDAGTGSNNDLQFESPVIDLTAAHAGGETLLSLDLNYAFNNLTVGVDFLAVEYFDADAGSYFTWESLPENVTTEADYDNCANLPYTSVDLDIAGFTATQLSGFKYRINYQDNAAWAWGYCIDEPTIILSLIHI